METSKLVKFLEDNGFEKNNAPKNGIDRFNAMLNKLEGKPSPEVTYRTKLESVARDEYGDTNLDAMLTVEIRPRDNSIEAEFMSVYPNFVWQEDQEYYDSVDSSNEDEIINFVKQYVDKKLDEIITSEMMNTILFINGQKASKEVLEKSKKDYLAAGYSLEHFLRNCGFDTEEEYEEYLKTLD